jgi:hypothetical protein
METPKKTLTADFDTPLASSRSTIVDGRDLEANNEKSTVVVDAGQHLDIPHKGEGESAFPEDKKIEALERLDRDWEHDLDNPRNWTTGRKWRMAGVVSIQHKYISSMLTMSDATRFHFTPSSRLYRGEQISIGNYIHPC